MKGVYKRKLKNLIRNIKLILISSNQKYMIPNILLNKLQTMPKVFKYKKIILKVCDGQHRHTEQIFFELKKYFPNISLSTVYRNINELIDSGELKEAIVLGGRSYYESTAKEHAHLIDTESGEIYDIDLPVVKMKGLPAGFSAQKISLNIYGTFKKSP